MPSCETDLDLQRHMGYGEVDQGSSLYMDAHEGRKRTLCVDTWGLSLGLGWSRAERGV